MTVNITVQRFVIARHRFHEWKNELDLARKTMLALMFACLTGIGALMRVPNPGLPAVPFTGQVYFFFAPLLPEAAFFSSSSNWPFFFLAFLFISLFDIPMY